LPTVTRQVCLRKNWADWLGISGGDQSLIFHLPGVASMF
jgi:hypothetical protein